MLSLIYSVTTCGHIMNTHALRLHLSGLRFQRVHGQPLQKLRCGKLFHDQQVMPKINGARLYGGCPAAFRITVYLIPTCAFVLHLSCSVSMLVHRK